MIPVMKLTARRACSQRRCRVSPCVICTSSAAAEDHTVLDLDSFDILNKLPSPYLRTPFSTLDSKTWAEALDSNARSAFLFAARAAPHMKRAGAGRIINFSDWTAVSDRPRYD